MTKNLSSNFPLKPEFSIIDLFVAFDTNIIFFKKLILFL